MSNIGRVPPPCGRDCESRAAGCHASCMAWAEYVGKRDESYAKRIDAEAVGAALCSRAERVRKIWEKGRR
jgi:hypothetical protein